MNSNTLVVDNYSLKFIFNEDLYFIKDSTLSAELTPSINTKVINPSIQNIKSMPTTSNKKIAVVTSSGKDLNTYEELVTKILQSIGVSMAEAEFISQDKPLSDKTTYSNYLVFGLENQKLTPFSSSIFLNQIAQEGNQKVIYTYPLEELEKSKDKKKGLWAALQSGFIK
jgi:hypothetical protein